MNAVAPQITGVSIVSLHSLLRRKSNKNIKALRYWSLRGESTGDRWIPLTKDK